MNTIDSNNDAPSRGKQLQRHTGEQAAQWTQQGGGWSADGRTNDSTRVESASTPRGVSAPMGSAIPDRDTRSREKKIERGERARETKYTRKTEWFQETREGGGREDLRNPLSPSENPRREARCRRCVDKPRSILLLMRASFFFSMFFQETVKLTSLFLPREHFLFLLLLLC